MKYFVMSVSVVNVVMFVMSPSQLQVLEGTSDSTQVVFVKSEFCLCWTALLLVDIVS